MGLFSLFGKKKQVTDDDFDMPVKPRRRAQAQEEEPLDPMLPEKKRARRRLIGATALVLAAVIGLPMVFDTEPKPLSDDVAVQIPSREKAGPNTSTPLPLPPADPRSAEPANSDAPKQDIPKQDTSKQEVSRAEPPKPEPAKAEPVKADAAKQDAVRHDAAKADAHKADEHKSGDQKTDAHKSDTHTADNHKADNPADKDKGRYVVQVAAVANKAKAEELQNRLKKAGIKSYSQKISTRDGERFRVRVGPFGTRDEADKMRSRLGKMGLTAVLQPA